MSRLPPQPQSAWNIGDDCMIYSGTHGGWHRGTVTRITKESSGTDISIAFSAGSDHFIKTVPEDSSDVKAIDFEELDVYCVCGSKMQAFKDKSTVYPNDEKSAEEAASDKPKGYASLIKDKIENLRCNLCASQIQDAESFFHCTDSQKVEIHVAGFDMCKACASTVSHADAMDLAIPEHEAAETGGTLACQVGDKPFAEGGMRYAYLAQLRIPSMMGRLCVIKKLKDCHPYSDEEWKGDMECVKMAKEMVDAYNEEVKPTKPLKINIPVVARRGSSKLEMLKAMGALLPALLSSEKDDGVSGELGNHLALLALLALLEVGNQEDEGKEDDVEDEVKEGECVVIEHFLQGDFVKWNSNSGWMMDDSLSIQAFCHWTYHWSKGKMLYVDAQGLRRPDCYILTDPCILSDTNEGRKYGITDLGINAILGWFKHHKCDQNKFCKTDEWLKPTEDQYSRWEPFEPIKATTCIRVQRTFTDEDLKAQKAAKATKALKPKVRGETAARAKAVEERREQAREELKKKEAERKGKKKNCLVM